MGLHQSKDVHKAVPSWELKELEHEPSYHWSMTRKDAQRALLQQGDNRCYLTRYSERKRAYLLSALGKENNKPFFEHFQFSITQKIGEEITCSLKDSDTMFSKVSEMLQYYGDNPISHQLSNIGVPVVFQTESEETTAKSPNKQSHSSGVEIIEAIGGVISKEIEEVGKVVVEYHQATTQKDTDREHDSSCPPPLEDNSVPSLKSLLEIKRKGSTRGFKLTQLISSKWFNIGILLGLSADTLENYRQESKDNEQRILNVFNHWINDAGCPPDYPMTWRGVLVLLRDIEMSTAAKELKESLESQGINLEH